MQAPRVIVENHREQARSYRVIGSLYQKEIQPARRI